MHGLTEFRLASGFIQGAVVFIGARKRDDIFRITSSDEMKGWHVPGRYNRPIPRRIGEEAGIPREAFGQRKMATVVENPSPHIPFSPELRKRYEAFLISNGIINSAQWNLMPQIRRWNTIATFASPSRYKSVYYASRAVSKLTGKSVRPPRFLAALNGSLFCFSANLRAAEYRSALKAASPAAPKSA
jgi:hypothetical protein